MFLIIDNNDVCIAFTNECYPVKVNHEIGEYERTDNVDEIIGYKDAPSNTIYPCVNSEFKVIEYDGEIPEEVLSNSFAYCYNNGEFIPNPNYVEPSPPIEESIGVLQAQMALLNDVLLEMTMA